MRPAVAAAATALVLLAGCDPVVGGARATPTPAVPASPPRGAPLDGTPATLADILAVADETAVTWQADPRPVEVAVELAGGRPVRAVVAYLAADADRSLEVRIADDGIGEDRPTLGAIGLLPVDLAGIEALPSPDGLPDPVALAAAAVPAVTACGGGAPTAITYDTGAPYAWDGTSWASAPVWGATAAAVAEDGARTGARVDPATGEAVGDDACFTLPPPR